MGGCQRCAWRSDNAERGAALTEFALLLPLLLMLVLGIVSVHGAREAGRFAATLPVANFSSEADPLQAWLDEVAGRVLGTTTGSLDVSTPGRFICIAYVHPNGSAAIDSTASRTQQGTDPAVYSPNPCFADGRPATERRVQILLRRDHDFNVFVFRRTLTLSADAVNRFEASLGA